MDFCSFHLDYYFLSFFDVTNVEIIYDITILLPIFSFMIFNIFIKSFRKAIFRLNDIIKIKKITRKVLFLNLVLLNDTFSAFFLNHFLTKYRVFDLYKE